MCSASSTSPGRGALRSIHCRAPERISDTREPLPADNQSTRGVGDRLPDVSVPVAGRGGLPPVSAMDSAVLVVTAVTSADTLGGFLSASAGGAPFSGSSNLNTNGLGDIRPNLVVVPLGADGTIDFHLLSIPDVVVDVVGYFTSPSAPASTAGRFHVIQPHREVDTRAGSGSVVCRGRHRHDRPGHSARRLVRRWLTTSRSSARCPGFRHAVSRRRRGAAGQQR